MSEWVSIQDAATEMCCSYSTIWRAIHNGKIPEDAVMEIPGAGDKGIVRVDLEVLRSMCKEAFRERKKKPGRPLSKRFTGEES